VPVTLKGGHVLLVMKIELSIPHPGFLKEETKATSTPPRTQLLK